MAKVKREISTSCGATGLSWLFCESKTKLSKKTGKTVVSERLHLKLDYDDCLFVCVEHRKKEGFQSPDENSEEIYLNADEVKSMRDWLVMQLPFSKQELVDMMSATVRGGA
ncbi:MAG: hypothetical protein CR991_11770 [Proteobacteria bacterium]|nr:MAG: hypothetical protein CR991_11770 [Pseudomonadota bacterium]